MKLNEDLYNTLYTTYCILCTVYLDAMSVANMHAAFRLEDESCHVISCRLEKERGREGKRKR